MGTWLLKGWVVYPQSKDGRPVSIQSQSINFESVWSSEKSRLAVWIVGFSDRQFKGDYTLYLNEKKKQRKKVSENFIHIIDIGDFSRGKKHQIKIRPWMQISFLAGHYVSYR